MHSTLVCADGLEHKPTIDVYLTQANTNMTIVRLWHSSGVLHTLKNLKKSPILYCVILSSDTNATHFDYAYLSFWL